MGAVLSAIPGCIEHANDEKPGEERAVTETNAMAAARVRSLPRFQWQSFFSKYLTIMKGLKNPKPPSNFHLTTVPHHDDIASSSMASASTPYVHYDVYIDFCDYNHCGRDAHTFATKLYNLLHSHQLQVFLDVPNLLFEDKIPAKVEEAILAASAHITIFPPNYVQSKWCLDKLVLLTKSSAQSRITILPVFYYAQPSELRWTGKGSQGACAEALRYYGKNNLYNSQTIQEWREALSNVTNLSGFVVDEDHADEEEILDKIVQTILNDFPYGPRYDVFLSHRGPDVKKTLASALYSRLTSCGLRVFLDELELVRGFGISPQIEIAIQFAHVNIAILSPTYADSTWCMEELNLMVTSRATILPVFYQVTRSDLRYGVYVEALSNHKKKQRYDSMTLQNWGDALSKVADLPDYCELDGNEEELLDNILKGVLKSVAKRSEHLRTSDVQNVVKSVLKDNAKVEITSEAEIKALERGSWLDRRRIMDFMSALFGGDFKRRKRAKNLVTVEVKIRMDCEGCERRVRSLVSSMKGVRSVEVNRNQSRLTVTGYVDAEKVLKRVKKGTGKAAMLWP